MTDENTNFSDESKVNKAKTNYELASVLELLIERSFSTVDASMSVAVSNTAIIITGVQEDMRNKIKEKITAYLNEKGYSLNVIFT